MIHNDTIAAIATAPGKGGIGVVRLSGKKALEIGQKITQSRLKPRHAHYCDFNGASQEVIDQGIAIYFKAPHSFTGEDVVELQGHGGTIILNMLLKATLELGARLAKPGEFSERAFLNDKLDLAQAEAIADMIDANSEAAAKSALRSLQGDFSVHIRSLVEALIHLRVHVEAAIDFPEEEIDFLADEAIQHQLSEVDQRIKNIQKSCQQGSILREGITVVIAGKPNAGKSSLLNALAGKESAIVTDIEGTTRDILREHIQINGVPLHIIDTAGLRISNDIVENEGIKRAIAAIKDADHILLVKDIHDCDHNAIDDFLTTFVGNEPLNIPISFIHNKSDLLEDIPKNDKENLYISAKNGIGIESLKAHLLESVGYHQTTEGAFAARQRHLEAIDIAQSHLALAQAQLDYGNGELLAEELLMAQNALNTITGDFSSDDLLGEIFSSFCIGK